MKYKIPAIIVACILIAGAAGYVVLSSGTFASAHSSQGVAGGSPVSKGYSLATENVMVPGSSGEVIAPVPTSVSSDVGGTGTDTKIISTADVTLEVSDVTATVDALKNLAMTHGGYLSSTDIQNYGNGLTGTVIIRVPQAGFDSAIAGVKSLGTVKSISTSRQDVTEQYVDFQAQKTSYTNQLAQYNVIMKQSTKVEDIIAVQEQIDAVQTQLDELNGRLNYLNNRIDISTITVSLQEPEPVGGQAGHDFVATINEGIAGFLGMIDVLIIGLFTLLPLVILGGIGYGVYRWHRGKKAVAPVQTEERKQD
jgi:hypothetical protein